MSEVHARGDVVPDELLKLLYVGKASPLLPRPHKLARNPDLEHAARSGNESDLSQLLAERRQKLLRHPGSAQEPPALPAVLYLDPVLTFRLRH